MNIYEHNQVQDIIKSYVQDQKILGIKVTYQEIANKLRMQKSYLSKIIAKQAVLSKDQAYLLANLICLDSQQIKYLFLIVDRDKAAIKEFKDSLDKEILLIQNSRTKSEDYLNKELNQTTTSQMQKYYLFPEVQLVHLALSIKEFQSKPERLKESFGISEQLYQDTIQTLVELELIEISAKGISLRKSNLHLPSTSPFFHQWQLQMKLKSIEWGKRLDDQNKYNFITSFTASEEDKDTIRYEFMSFLKKVEVIVKHSKSKNLYQMNFDLFKWL